MTPHLRLPAPSRLALLVAATLGCSGGKGDSGDTTGATVACSDGDGDLVCDDVDICTEGPDQADFDADGTPDACDGCPLDASGTDGDADGDGVCDASDVCAGFPDDDDYDADGVPDGCDACGTDPADSVDSDADGVCDAADVCDGFDDTIDADGDLVPDGCDACPIDADDDSDGDGVCDSDDLCLGDDATGDTDADGECDDYEPQPPPRDFTATASGRDVTLTWTNFPGPVFGTTVVVRQYVDVVDGVPVSGTTPVAGDPIGTTGEVVYVGTAESFTDTSLEEGAVFYQAWTITTAGRVGDWGTRSWTLIDRGLEQAGDLSVDLSSGAVSVGTAPTGYTLAGSATYDETAGSVEVTIDLTSLRARRVFYPKLAVRSLTGASVEGDATYEGDPVINFGPEAMLPGVAVSRTFTLTGVDGSTDPLSLDFEIVDHRAALAPEDYSDPSVLVDLGGTGLDVSIDTDAIGFKPSEGQMTRGFFREDGAVAYGGARNKPVVAMYDADTATITEALSLGTFGSVAAVHPSPDGRWIYAAYATTHLYDSGSNDPTMELVRIERDTMTEESRVELEGSFPNDAVPRNFNISADGSRVAVLMRDAGRVFVVDTDTMTVIDGDTTTDDENGFNTDIDDDYGHDIPSAIALSTDGSTLYVGYRYPNEVDVIDVASWTVTDTWYHPTYTSSSIYSSNLHVDAEGDLHWLSQNGGLVTFDTATGDATLQTGSIGEDWLAAEWGHDGTTLFLRQESGSGANIWGFDTSTDTWLDLDSSPDDGEVGPAPQPTGDSAHLLAVTAF